VRVQRPGDPKAIRLAAATGRDRLERAGRTYPAYPDDMGHLVDRRRVLRVRGAGTDVVSAQEQPDQLAVEAPLTLQVGGQTVATTMRTPGHDLELALGWLVAEGVARRPADVVEATSCDVDTVRLRLAPGIPAPKPRLGATSSACGVCGSDSIDEVLARRGPGPVSGLPLVDAAVIAGLPDRLRTAQRAFARTGGLHAAGLFTVEGEAVCIREDVGRHNAVDKVVGWALQADLLPAASLVLQVSGRASFELTQKAAMAGIPLLAAVSAPSTLAVDLAREAGLTLVGFVRDDSMNVYAGSDRVVIDPAAVRETATSSQSV
jgi:FdhD protein